MLKHYQIIITRGHVFACQEVNYFRYVLVKIWEGVKVHVLEVGRIISLIFLGMKSFLVQDINSVTSQL